MLTNAARGFFYAAQLLKSPTSFVLAALKGSPYVREYDFAFSLAAALSGQERVSAREGWAGETDGTFEQLILQANPKAVNA